MVFRYKLSSTHGDFPSEVCLDIGIGRSFSGMTDPCFLKYIMNEVVVVLIICASISEEGKRHEVFNLLSPHHIHIIVDQFHDIDFGWDIRLD